MNVLNILKENGFFDCNNNWTKLSSNITTPEVIYLKTLIEKYQPKQTLEIGCAQGISTLTICESIGKDSFHTIIDPYQTTEWKSYGINNVKKAGFSNFKLIEEKSQFALPDLCRQQKQYDFVFVDGWHTFDHVMLEFFYINYLLPIGGIVVFDDSSFQSINKVLRYISNYPNYICLGSAGTLETEKEKSSQRVLLEKGKFIIHHISRLFGKTFQREFLNDTVARLDNNLKINGSITAFQKTGEDTRNWNWYQIF